MLTTKQILLMIAKRGIELEELDRQRELNARNNPVQDSDSSNQVNKDSSTH